MKPVLMTGVAWLAMASIAAYAGIGSDADALVPAAQRIADPYTSGLARGWLEIATRQDRTVLISSTYNDAAPKALQNARHFIDGSVPFVPIYGAKHWPSASRPDWIAAIREIERVDERVSHSPCRGEAAGRLSALTDEVWKEQDETHGTRWVHGWAQIERARALARQVDRELDTCVPATPVVNPLAEPGALSSDTLFGFDSAALTPEGEQAIAQLAGHLKPLALRRLTVTGYTDRIGSEAYNLALSRRRADAVASALAAAGVQAEHIETRGLGRADPAIDCPGPASSAVIACLAPNRRVTVRVDATQTQLPVEGPGWHAIEPNAQEPKP
ncbi:OmpA family protein [Burkholderia stagnalis]